MQILYWFQSIRNPVLDRFFSLVTMLGEETVFLVLGILIFWCVNKQKGYFILSVGFLGLLVNQFLKISCRVPRPWVKDPQFTIVESAREAATGYSFPSGHTQISVGAYGSIARAWKNRTLRFFSVLLCVLVPVSRLYLGVHTLADVATSVLVALLLIFVLYPWMNRLFNKKHGMRLFLGGMAVLSLGYLIYMLVFSFPMDTDAKNLADAMANAYKIFGSIVGVWLGYELDCRFVRFEAKAPWKTQLMKLVLGIFIVLLIKSALKEPLYLLCGKDGMADSIRYFLITLFVCGVWPFVFSRFGEKQIK
ncbi:MAG: phosphatase PAP2 family protein [Clostridia bacterium]|nr:phosphatase PAP2 family protein [Clostridia bacterium]